MPTPENMSQPGCQACASNDLDDFLRPYCSVVCRSLARFGLSWRTDPYRIVVASHPHLVVQAGPHFNLREPALKASRERALTTERKQRQRARGRRPDVTPTTQHNASTGVLFTDSGVEKL